MNNCAILVFAKNASTESNSKRIVSAAKANTNLWSILNKKTLQIAQKSKIPFFIVNDSIQIGATFGERITNAVQSVFDLGFEKVIAIGNDCPELTVHHLQEAKRELQTNDFVFGPDFKGGAYLLGISKKYFEPTNFENFNWQSRNLFTSLTDFYKHNQLKILPFLNDVNDFFSFKNAVNNLSFKSKLKIDLLYFFIFKNQTFYFVLSKIRLFIVLFRNYRGPPRAAITAC